MQRTLLGCVALIIVILFLAVIAGALSGIGIYNSLVTSSQGVDKQWAQVQNVYQRRADLIPNLVSTVQGAANFEKSTLVEVTQARASVGQVKIDPNTAPTDADQLAKYQHAQDGLSSALSHLMVIVERYPDLKANSNFLNLQAQLEGTENRISVERGRFNDAVQAYNTMVQRFPAVFIAPMMGFKPKPYFQASAGSDVAPKVNFSFGTPTPAKP